jgi:hypothetical protein
MPVPEGAVPRCQTHSSGPNRTARPRLFGDLVGKPPHISSNATTAHRQVVQSPATATGWLSLRIDLIASLPQLHAHPPYAINGR